MNDVRLALRRLLHAPLFTTVAVLTLALGIGANSAVFSVVNGVLIRPLPYPDEGKLMAVYAKDADGEESLSPRDFISFQRESRLVAPVAAYREWTFNVSAGERPEKANGVIVTADFFKVVGVAPALGRLPEETSPGHRSTSEVVIGDGYWRTNFGGRADIIGKVIDLNGEPVSVVGVMPRGYDIPADVQIWRPSPFAVPPTPLRPTVDTSNEPDTHYFEVIGRVPADVSVTAARAEASAIMHRNARIENGKPEFDGASLITVHEDRVGESRPALLLLLGSAGVLLLIASVNLANLLLARAASRSREWLVRSALGAGRWQLAKEQLIESLLLSLLGGGVGLLVATWGVASLRALAPAELQSLIDASPDWRVVAFTMTVAIVTGLAFGVGPALQSGRGELATGMREGGRGAVDSRARRRVRNGLAVSEVALACVLAVGAGLLVKAFVKVQQVPEGFEARGVVTMALALPQVKYPDTERRATFVREMLMGIGTLPQVTSAGVISRLPLNPGSSRSDLKVEGRTPRPDDPNPDYLVASEGYFKTLSIPFIAGRDFDLRDMMDAPQVAIVSAVTAQRYFGTTDVLGKRIQVRDDRWRTIVGVVADVRQHELDRKPIPAVYLPYGQDPWANFTLTVRGNGSAAAMTAPVEAKIHAVDADQAVYAVRTMDEVVSRSLAARKFTLTLIGLFTSIALLLAAVGVYGVIAYGVAQRTREMGVRVALGALPGDVVRLVVRDGVLMAAAGVAAGLAAAVLLAPVLQQMLYAVEPRDPATFGTVGGMVILVALLASYLPARRASRADPLEALREE
ncbi:MAG TPA: ABC transporter permease [Gemmatimonadaceae bacterium]|nr:ABC transporter permease [Gemmatimonadaceae bacterium]